MNYGKLGYYIAKENEIKIDNILTDKYSAFNCEYYEDFENRISITNGSNYSFPSLKNRSGKEVTYEITFDCECEQYTQFCAKILVNGSQVGETISEIQSKMHCVNMGQFETDISENANIDIVFSSVSSNFVISNIKLLIMGNGVKFIDYDSTIYFDMVKSDNRVICYYIKNKKLYTATKLPSFVSLNISDMNYTGGAISASYVFSKSNNTQNQKRLCLLYVNDLGDLYYKDVDASTEKFLMGGISCVSAATIPSTLNEDILCGVVQNGKAKYFTISRNNDEIVVSKPVEIYVRDEVAQTVQAVNTSSQNIFIIVKTHKNNYIFVNGEEIFEQYCIDSANMSLISYLAELENNEYVYEEL